jgi:hypothetical protein
VSVRERLGLLRQNHRIDDVNHAVGGFNINSNDKVAGGRVWFIDPGREDLARMPATKFARLAERGEIEATMIPTPEEEDFFRVLDVPCWPPHERTVERLRRHLQQK